MTHGTISAAEKVLAQETVPWRKRLFPFLGPAFIAAVAYIDPGNFATNIQSGAQLGYTLLWVIIISNLMAMLVQILSAKLGIATGLNLAELCRNHFPAPLVWAMWVTLEIVAIATDLAEFVGAAVGLFLLFHIPLIYAGLLTAVVTFLILGLQRYGFRPLEAIITAMIGIVAVSYLIEIFLVKAEPAQIVSSLFIPRFGGRQGVLLATGILGATVMPHVIFLHSALTQGRIIVKDIDKLKRLFRFEIMDVAIAMTIAGAVNAAMLIMAASTFYAQGLREIGTLEEAYRTLSPLLGPAAGKIFAIALIAAGLSSSAVGTMSGQVVMQGFVHFTNPALDQAPGYGPALAGRSILGTGPNKDACNQPGRAQLWASLCSDPARSFYGKQKNYGAAGKQAAHLISSRYRNLADSGAEFIPDLQYSGGGRLTFV